MIIRPEQFEGSDVERIQQAVNQATEADTVMICGENQKVWLLDNAILLSSGKHIEIHDCTLKLSDKCRDNFFRSANCGFGIHKHDGLRDIRLLGFGNAVLEGADVPRSTGDAGKTLYVESDKAPDSGWSPISFGTDAGKTGENPKGDWRNIGILLVNVENFAICGLTLRESHCWAISLERCSQGKICGITMDSHDPIVIAGKLRGCKNKDGIDLRYGCHHIDISDISGSCGDDVVALTSRDQGQNPGEFRTEVSQREEGVSYDIHHVTIRNVNAWSPHQMIRLLCSYPAAIHDIEITGVQAAEGTLRACILGDVGYGGIKGQISNVTIRDFKSWASRSCIELMSVCRNIVIEDVTNYNANVPLVKINWSAEVSGLECRNNKNAD